MSEGEVEGHMREHIRKYNERDEEESRLWLEEELEKKRLALPMEQEEEQQVVVEEEGLVSLSRCQSDPGFQGKVVLHTLASSSSSSSFAPSEALTVVFSPGAGVAHVHWMARRRAEGEGEGGEEEGVGKDWDFIQIWEEEEEVEGEGKEEAAFCHGQREHRWAVSCFGEAGGKGGSRVESCA